MATVMPTDSPIISGRLLEEEAVDVDVLERPLVTTLEEVTVNPPKLELLLSALARDEEAAETTEAELPPEEEVSPLPVATDEPDRILVKVMASTLDAGRPMAESRAATRESMLVRTAEGVAERVMLKPILTLFWHFQFFLV